MKFTDPHKWWLWVVSRRRPEVRQRQVQAAMDLLMAQNLSR